MPGPLGAIRKGLILNFKQLLAKYVTENLPTHQLPEIGIKGLEEALDSPSLCILAGLNKDENPFVIEDYFKLALKELRINLPNERQAAIEYILAIIENIISRKTDIIDGIEEIKTKAIDSYDFFSESVEFCYDSIGFEKIYGLYDSYCDLLGSDIQWDINKNNVQLMQEIKQDLYNEIPKWKEILINGA